MKIKEIHEVYTPQLSVDDFWIMIHAFPQVYSMHNRHEVFIEVDFCLPDEKQWIYKKLLKTEVRFKNTEHYFVIRKRDIDFNFEGS